MKLYKPGYPVEEFEADITETIPAADGTIGYCTNPILDRWERAYVTKRAAAKAWAQAMRNVWHRADNDYQNAKYQLNLMDMMDSIT